MFKIQKMLIYYKEYENKVYNIELDKREDIEDLCKAQQFRHKNFRCNCIINLKLQQRITHIFIMPKNVDFHISYPLSIVSNFLQFFGLS
ncbi:unnamed protein product [Paramecium octaurelia]|uniref:Uncharacterized protein n=1 Tax=Paramecium octaurelia TaxID=43137 RepID=A0A8S1X2J5_PAROT|nr:unnamed protein product [Paramecium octaurelia]